MAEQVRQTNASEIQQFIDLVYGNSLGALRRKDYLEWQIAVLQSRLSDLRLNYKMVQSRILNNIDTQTVAKMNADGSVQIKPIQSFQYIELGFPNPTQLYSYEKGKLLEDESIRVLVHELERIEHEIKALPAQIKAHKKSLDNINIILASAANDPKKPSSADLYKDKIARRQTASVFQLYNLHIYYYENTTNGTTRAYPEDAKILRGLSTVREQFQSHARSLMEKTYTELQKLNLKDPGATENGVILIALVNKLRKTTVNEKIYETVKKNINNLTSVINDPKLSRGINRKPPPNVPSAESMRAITRTYTLGIANFLPKSWSFPIYLNPYDAVAKMWKLKNKDLNQGLPVCPDALPDINANDVNKAEVQAKDKIDQAKGSQQFQRDYSQVPDDQDFANAFKEEEAVQQDINEGLPGALQQFERIQSSVNQSQ